MKTSIRSILRVTAVAAGLVTVSLGFQNCAGKGFQVANLEEAIQQQNVEPELVIGNLKFDRKIAVSASCADGLEAVIEVLPTGTIQLSRKNCKNLDKPEKLDIYKTAKMAHNPSFLIYDGKLFRLDPASVTLAEGEALDPELELPTEGICRNELNELGVRRVTDVRIFKDANGKSKAKVLMGEYRSGSLSKAFKSVEMKLERVYDQDNITQDQAIGLAEGQNFALTLNHSAPAVVGEINFTKSIFGTDGPESFVDGENYLSPGMSCYQ